MKKLSDRELHMLEVLLLRASKHPAAAGFARFTVFMLLMSECRLSWRDDGQADVSLRLPRSTLDALRAVCALVTGVAPDGLSDGEVMSAHLDEAMRRRDEHLAHLVALVRAKAPKGARGRRDRARAAEPAGELEHEDDLTERRDGTHSRDVWRSAECVPSSKRARDRYCSVAPASRSIAK